jgi:hypothetical protein
MKHKKGIVFLLLLTLICSACSESEEPNSQQTPEDTFLEAVSTLEEGTMKKIGDTVIRKSITDADMEYTVMKVEIFDHYTEAGIPKSEFVFGLNENKLVMVDVKVKKIRGPERQDEDHDDNINCLYLLNRRILEEENRDNVMLPEMCYFSGHGEGDKKYPYYWLDPGEEATYRVGWCLTGSLTDTENLVLNISAGLVGGEYIDLTT